MSAMSPYDAPANIKQWLLTAEAEIGEVIQAIVVGEHPTRRYSDPPLPDENILLTREGGLAKVDENFNDGFGGPDCYPVYAWSLSWVFFVHEYDGATSLRRIPRHPVPCKPEFGANSY